MADDDDQHEQQARLIGRNQVGVTLLMPITFLNPRSASLSSWREWLTDQAEFQNVRVEHLGKVLQILGSETPPAS